MLCGYTSYAYALLILTRLRVCSVAPEITMPNRRMGQARGRQTILECVITAFPQTVNYWEKDGRKLSSSAKYHVDVYDDGAHRIVLYVL